jgi:hypothetical protein
MSLSDLFKSELEELNTLEKGGKREAAVHQMTQPHIGGTGPNKRTPARTGGKAKPMDDQVVTTGKGPVKKAAPVESGDESDESQSASYARKGQGGSSSSDDSTGDDSSMGKGGNDDSSAAASSPMEGARKSMANSRYAQFVDSGEDRAIADMISKGFVGGDCAPRVPLDKQARAKR